MNKVFIIGKIDLSLVDGNFKRAQELAKENEVYVLTLIASKEMAALLEAAFDEYAIKTDYLLQMPRPNKDVISMAEEHAFINLCLKAIQLEKPQTIYLVDDGRSYMNANIRAKIESHAKHLDAKLLDNSQGVG